MAYDKELALVHQWLDATDEIALEHFRIGALTEIKEDGTPVTIGDREVERALRRHLEDSFPGDAVLGEEEGATGSGDRRWIIDPIDGTKNYARGVPVFATLIALEVDGSPAVGFVSAPALGARWWAARGEGAFSNGAPIQVSAVSSLEQADVCSGGVDWAIEGAFAEGFRSLAQRARRTRGFGDFWGHMLVAQGSMDVMVEFAPLAVWDVAAPKVIVEEAGGRMTPLSGDGLTGAHLTTNGELHAEVLRALAG